MRPLRPLVVFALSLATGAAQELRHIDVPYFAHVCFDPIRECLVGQSLGGYSMEWDGTTWRQAPDVGAPRGFHYVDVSTSRPCTVAQQFVGTGFQLTFWERDGSEWQIVPSPGAPPLRNDIALCYDSARDEVVAFGGFSPATLTPLGDTWVWNGTSWAQRNVTGPPPRGDATLAFDAVRQRVVLFGGYTSQTTFLDDTWEWDGTAWTQVPVVTKPPPRLRAQAVYDPGRQRVVMIGPASTAGFPIEHWEYDGTTWSSPTATLPSSSLSPVVGHDPVRGETLLLGGYDSSGVHGEVWAWNGTTWSQRNGWGHTPSQSFGTEVAAHPTATDVQLYAPWSSATPGPTDELWTWNGTAWSRTSAGGPGPRHDAAFWRLQNDSYVFGGLPSITVVNDLWRWDGTAWTQIPLAVNPPARSRASTAVDVLRDRVVLFGGYVGAGWSNDTWIFDGTAWSPAPSLPSPSARYSAAMAFDPVRDRIVLHGGLGGSGGTTVLSDTWEWNGTQWQQVPTSNAPPPEGRMTYDAPSQRVLYCAPSPGSRSYEIWTYDGSDWTQQTLVGTANASNPLRASLPRPVTTSEGTFVVDQYSGMHRLLVTPARTVDYGSSCGNDAPTLAAASLPRVPDASFGLHVTRAPANAPVRIAGADTSGSASFFGCSLLVAPNVTTLFGMSSPTGHAAFPLAIPNTAALVGMSVYFQAAVLSATNPNGFALSEGLQVDLGN